MNFSRPFRSRSQQQSPASPNRHDMSPPQHAPGPEATPANRQSIADPISERPQGSGSAPTSSREQPKQYGMSPAELGELPGYVKSKLRYPRYYNVLTSPAEHDEDAYLASKGQDMPVQEKPEPPPQQTYPKKRQRYYAHALTKEDKHALAIGEQNHNHREWTPTDLLKYHDGRQELVPRGADPQSEMLQQMAIERNQSRIFVAEMQKVSRFRRRKPEIPKFGFYQQDAYSMQNLQSTESVESFEIPKASQSMVNLRGGDGSPESSLDDAASKPHSLHVSTGDYFSNSPRRQQIRNLNRASRLSRNVSSPLASEVPSFTPNTNVTFDSFLVPHASGKGEAYTGAKNAKNYVKATEDVEIPSLRKRTSTRLSRMASMPSLRGKKSKGDDDDDSTTSKDAPLSE